MAAWGQRAGADYASVPTDPLAGDRLVAEYFERQVRELEARSLAGVRTQADWEAQRVERRQQMFEMLGMGALPPRGDLRARVTGSQRHGEIEVENIVFQSLPGLYVTANLYRPATVEGRLPAVLYVCGHAGVKEDGVSFGNKTAYHHHGVWFARNGYVCLTIDTVQLGEIEGIHHGTYREGRWWWNARGYSSAAVEAWNGIRAIDYLVARPEVDPDRLGVTGRSGGGAYSWWVAALDERVRVAVPVAGIASLQNHVVDGTVEGHCDCMFHVNTYRWGFGEIAALVAPRPLLIVNTDKDPIFPLDGVVDVYNEARRIYRLLGAEDNIGLAISEGGHMDTQPLRTEAFHWFERHLKGADITAEIDARAPKALERESLRVLDAIPADEIVTRIDESFVAQAAPPGVPADAEAWRELREHWMAGLEAKCVRGWPEAPAALELREVRTGGGGGEGSLVRYEFTSEEPFRLPLVVALPRGERAAGPVVLLPVDEVGWRRYQQDGFAALSHEADERGETLVLFAPRGVGPTAWTSDERERIQIRRRFMLLGQTLDGMRCYDITRAIAAVGAIDGLGGRPLELRARGRVAGQALYATLFSEGVSRLRLEGLHSSHAAEGAAVFLNVMRVLDTPAAVAMAAERCAVELSGAEGVAAEAWAFPLEAAAKFGWSMSHLGE